jgi:hypothetical protein
MAGRLSRGHLPAEEEEVPYALIVQTLEVYKAPCLSDHRLHLRAQGIQLGEDRDKLLRSFCLA